MFSYLLWPKPLPLGAENPCVNSSYRDSIDEYQDHDSWHTLPLQDQDINPLCITTEIIIFVASQRSSPLGSSSLLQHRALHHYYCNTMICNTMTSSLLSILSLFLDNSRLQWSLRVYSSIRDSFYYQSRSNTCRYVESIPSSIFCVLIHEVIIKIIMFAIT